MYFKHTLSSPFTSQNKVIFILCFVKSKSLAPHHFQILPTLSETIMERLRVNQAFFRGDAIVFLRAASDIVKLHRVWLQTGQHCSTGAQSSGAVTMEADADQR